MSQTLGAVREKMLDTMDWVTLGFGIGTALVSGGAAGGGAMVFMRLSLRVITKQFEQHIEQERQERQLHAKQHREERQELLGQIAELRKENSETLRTLAQGGQQ